MTVKLLIVVVFLQILLMKGLQNGDRGKKEEYLEQTVLVSGHDD